MSRKARTTRKATTQVTRTDPVAADELQTLRRKLYEFVNQAVDDFPDILSGHRKLNQMQVAILKMAMGKVMPDLTAKAVEVRKTSSHVTMSRDELEALVAQGKSGSGTLIPFVPTPSREAVDPQPIEIPEESHDEAETESPLSEKDREILDKFLRDLGDAPA